MTEQTSAPEPTVGTDDVVEAAVTTWLSVPEVADVLGIDVLRVRNLIKDRQVLACRRGENNALSIPADFLLDGQLLKGLGGTLSVLADSGFSDSEALRWLFTDDPTLPGHPVAALRANRITEIRRRAQALAF